MKRIIIMIGVATVVFASPDHAIEDDSFNELRDNHRTRKYSLTSQAYEIKKLGSSSFYDQANPVKQFFLLLIKSYQHVFSKQDGSTCQFRPTCSHFGASAIKTYGPFQGFLLTSDRILRCNPFTYGLYPLSEDNLHHLDPIQDHVLWQKEKATTEFTEKESQRAQRKEKSMNEEEEGKRVHHRATEDTEKKTAK